MRKSTLLVTLIAALSLLPLFAFVATESKPEARESLLKSLSRNLNTLVSEQATEEEKAGSWARKMLDSLTLDEKIGQLFMIAAYSNKNETHYSKIQALVEKEKIGGLIFMQGGPGRQISLINRYQKAARVPLLIAQDSEWGLNMRLDSTIRFPKNMTLGAIRDSLIIFELGQEMGQQCRRVGVQVNFAPVVDVNNNPNNPVINDRSFGENRENVATKGIYIYKGMEYAGTIGCAKHFPGHGDTDTDSHLDLPIIPHPRTRLDSLELYPFKQMLGRGAASVMVAHLYIPALDTTKNLASTLSPKIVTDLLKKEMGFNGLIFTDALGMKGVTKFWEEGETDLKAFIAGNDVLLFSGNVPKAKKLIKEAIERGEVSEKELNRRVLKILVAKEWTGLHQQRISPQVAPNEMLRPEAAALRKQLYQQAMTLVKNDDNILPLSALERRKIAVVEIGAGEDWTFYDHLRTYADMAKFSLLAISEKSKRDQLLKALKDYDTVILGVDGMSKRSKRNFGISGATLSFVKALKATKKDLVVCLFGSPYALKYFGDYADGILVAYEDQPDAKIAAAEAIAGAIPVDGILPVTASKRFKEGTSLTYEANGAYQFAIPEAAGMDGAELERIDSIAEDAIKMGATPGLAVLAMRNNKVVFHRAYGKTEYGKAGKRVDPFHTLYDLASVTKVAATTVSTMKLVHDGKLDIEAPVSAYLSDFRGKNMTHIKVKNLLMHNAGFRSWIPFYTETFDSTGKELDKDIYSDEYTDYYCVKVVDGLYMCPDYQDTMWVKIVNSKIRTDKKVRYSDLGMIVMRRVIESAAGVPFDRFVDSVFYKPMGMHRTGFNPAETMPGYTCAPTEVDDYWRHKKVEGYVHDQASAMLGGVSGHAGLFSNVYDLAKIFAMVGNGGSYGGMKYFTPEIVAEFTKRQNPENRKGLGWDKHEPDSTKSTPCSQYASELTYGHTGFTGIGVWADPKYDLVYIFLSNRTFPKSTNKKLQRENIRPKIHDALYRAIDNYEKRK